MLRAIDGFATAHKLNFSLGLTRSGRLRNVDFAAGGVLHLADGLATLSDNHTDSLVWDVNSILNLLVCVVSRIGATLWGRTVAVVILAVTLHNLHDHLFGLGSGSVGPNQVDRTEAIQALGLADDVDVAAASLLKVPDRFAASANDEAHGTVRNHDLQAVLSVLQVGYTTTIDDGGRGAGSTSVKTCTSNGAHATVLYNAIDLRHGLGAPSGGASDLAHAKLLVGIGGSDELHPALGLALDASEVLALTANDQTDQASLDLHGLGVVTAAAAAAEWRALSSRVATTRGERTGGLTATGARRVGSVA